MKPLCRGVDKEVGLWVVRDDRLLIMNTCFSCFLCSLKVVCANNDDDRWTLAQRNGGLATQFHEATPGWGHVTPGQKMHLPTAQINGGGDVASPLSPCSLSPPVAVVIVVCPTTHPHSHRHNAQERIGPEERPRVHVVISLVVGPSTTPSPPLSTLSLLLRTSAMFLLFSSTATMLLPCATSNTAPMPCPRLP